jgi:hypothetical protein
MKLKFAKFDLEFKFIRRRCIKYKRTVSGNATIQGNLKKPAINGRLYVERTGLTIPYLNVDYELNDRSVIDVRKFLFRSNTPTDSKFGTKEF